MKVTIELDLPEGQEVPSVHDILTLTSRDWLVDRWHISDVQQECDWLTDEQAREVLEMMHKHRDCNIGINWEMINATVNNFYPQPDEEEA
jgi:hypothetical protein